MPEKWSAWERQRNSWLRTAGERCIAHWKKFGSSSLAVRRDDSIAACENVALAAICGLRANRAFEGNVLSAGHTQKEKTKHAGPTRRNPDGRRHRQNADGGLAGRAPARRGPARRHPDPRLQG